MKTQKRTTNGLNAEGLNLLNKEGKIIITEVIEAMKPFKGNKFTIIGGFVSKFKKPTPKTKTTFYIDASHSSIWIKTKLCLNGGSYDNNTYYCQYFEQSYYIGQLEGDNIKELKEPDFIINDYKLNQKYTEKSLNKLCNDFKVAQEKANVIYNKIPDIVKSNNYIRK